MLVIIIIMIMQLFADLHLHKWFWKFHCILNSHYRMFWPHSFHIRLYEAFLRFSFITSNRLIGFLWLLTSEPSIRSVRVLFILFRLISNDKLELRLNLESAWLSHISTSTYPHPHTRELKRRKREREAERETERKPLLFGMAVIFHISVIAHRTAPTSRHPMHISGWCRFPRCMCQRLQQSIHQI